VSDHIQHVIDLSTTAEAAEDVADGVRQWLLAEQVVVEDPTEPSRYLAGPRWTAATTPIDPAERYGEVDIRTGRTRYDAVEAWQPLCCPACGHQAEVTSSAEADAVLDELVALGNAWENTGEPTVACRVCGHTAPLGDWDGLSVAIGNVAVSFVNWQSTLAPSCVAALRTRLGLRVVVVDERY
jgi:hypothetical protein